MSHICSSCLIKCGSNQFICHISHLNEPIITRLWLKRPIYLAICNGGYFSETSLRPRIPPARPRDPVIHIKPQAPKARGYCCRCLIRIQVRNKEQSLSPEPRLNGECWDTVTLAQFGVKLERVNDMIMCFGELHIYLLQSSILMHLLTTFDFRETDLEIDYVRRHIAWRLRFRFLSVY